MNFLNKFFKSEKKTDEQVTETEPKKTTESELGEFNLLDYPEKDREKSFYFYEYNKPDGEWINLGEPICKIRIGDSTGIGKFYGASIKATKSGVLEWTLNRDELLKNDKILFKIHKSGVYKNENSIENFEFKSYFSESKLSSFNKWLVADGSLVKENQDVYQFSDSLIGNAQLVMLGAKVNNNTTIHKSEKSGYIDLYFKKALHIPNKELMYVIKKDDNDRINRKFINEPNIIIDEFSNSTIIKWNKVSSKFANSKGIKTKSDDLSTDFIFSFNYIDNNDQIVFYFDSKQIKPKQFDKVSFLFENGEQIVFELANNPISVKKTLEYKGIITLTELELFSKSNFKKWKISLVNDKREILGGETSDENLYPNKNNIQIVIKKFVNEYIELVKKTIPKYQPTELKQKEPIKETLTDFCFVYLMHDTSNNYYKIGISNNPEYRESTLQSEKPTIEMIASKKFPIRKIADSIEKALHNTYSEKRLRGEWFELNTKDVEDIKETLK
ncbi:GIY-YIG nuclease family protein [Psychroserpens damuponensis]|uniref:GIY-YIG nuclease family protein n=1 Tax=Psychroserpens damuponensis TaxID=943936 RepID=UPI00058DF6B3|nr:GIY-YIG nuclease family protein [Psychroserpens damuponensis]